MTLWPVHFRLAALLLALAAGLFLNGCLTLNDPETSQEFRSHTVGIVTPETSFGQSFTARRSGLNQILLWLQPGEKPQDGILTATLYQTPGDSVPLAIVRLRLKTVTRQSPLAIHFPAQPDPPGQPYYLLLQVDQGSLGVLGRDEDQYAFGQAYVNGAPQPVDASFRVGYDYGPRAMLEDARLALLDIWLAIPLLLVLWLPGYVLLRLAGFQRHFDWGKRVAISLGLSLSVIPVVLLWTSTFGLHWNRAGVWLAVGGLALALIWLTLRTWALQRTPLKRKLTRKMAWDGVFAYRSMNPMKRSSLSVSLALAGVFVFSLAIRLVMVRDLSAPAWVDSVHHALITRLVLDNGAFPATYAPYLDLPTANYHAGFHSTLALFQALSGLELSRALLIYGQVLNAAMVFATYLLSTTLTRNRLAGVLAALVVGVFTPMPAYYTSWGRYTQLAGLLILPVVFATLVLSQKKGKDTLLFLTWRRGTANSLALLVLAGLAGAGLFLTHYRVLVFAACLLIAWGAVCLLAGLRQPGGRPRLARLLIFGLLAGLIGIAFSYPWWPETVRTLIWPSALRGNVVTQRILEDFSWSYLTTASGLYCLVLAGAGLAWGMLQRRKFPGVLLGWVGLMFLLANLGLWGLPGSRLINSTSVTISLFLPVAVLVGYLLSWLLEGWARLLPGHWRPALWLAAVISLSVLSLLGSRSIITILNPGTLLFRQPDRPAIAWAAEHLPPEAAILINPFSWGYGVYAGSDGGYWLSPLALHPTVPPPVLYGLVGGAGQQVSRLSREVIQSNTDATALAQILRQAGIDYVFCGARGGVLSPALLYASPEFEVIYSQDGVWVFKVRN